MKVKVLREATDKDMIIDEIIKPAVEWYREYCDWEDRNIARERGF